MTFSDARDAIADILRKSMLSPEDMGTVLDEVRVVVNAADNEDSSYSCSCCGGNVAQTTQVRDAKLVAKTAMNVRAVIQRNPALKREVGEANLMKLDAALKAWSLHND